MDGVGLAICSVLVFETNKDLHGVMFTFAFNPKMIRSHDFIVLFDKH